MIDLHKDLFARMVISAQKDRGANSRFKENIVFKQNPIIQNEKKSAQAQTPTVKIISKTSPAIQKTPQSPNKTTTSISKPSADVSKIPSMFPLQSVKIKESTSKDNSEKLLVYDVKKPLQATPYHKMEKKINIDEQISKIVDNPELHSLKEEIHELESLFIDLKKKHAGHEALERIERKILELKDLADRKSYV